MDLWIVLAVTIGTWLLLAQRTGPAIADEPPMTDPTTDPTRGSSGYGSGVRTMAMAIAYAEGFGTPGALPTRAHNPGDLVAPWTGHPGIGPEGITNFPDDDAGWEALHRQLQLIADGRSGVYTVRDTIATMARKWTRTDVTDWADNVVAWYRHHGAATVTRDTELCDLLLDD